MIHCCTEARALAWNLFNWHGAPWTSEWWLCPPCTSVPAQMTQVFQMTKNLQCCLVWPQPTTVCGSEYFSIVNPRFMTQDLWPSVLWSSAVYKQELHYIRKELIVVVKPWWCFNDQGINNKEDLPGFKTKQHATVDQAHTLYWLRSVWQRLSSNAHWAWHAYSCAEEFGCSFHDLVHGQATNEFWKQTWP